MAANGPGLRVEQKERVAIGARVGSGCHHASAPTEDEDVDWDEHRWPVATSIAALFKVKANRVLDRVAAGPTRAPEVGRRWVLGVVALAPFLVVLEDHAMAIALPSLGRDLGLGLAGLQWVVNVYTVSAAVLTLWGGMLADRFGARPVFLAGLVLFTAPSLVAGLSTNGALLIGMRAAQGAGAALMGPAALAILVTCFSGRLRGLAVGVWSGAAASATASGPLLGALLTENAGWRSIFLVNVPLGVVMLIIAGIALPVSRPSSRRARVDVAGAAASALGLAALVFGLTQATSYGWTSVRLWGVLGVAAVAFAIFVVVERRAPAPLLDRHLFRLPSFLAADVLGLLNVAILCSLLFFLSLYLQLAIRFSAARAGVALLPLTLLVAIVAPLAGWLVSRAGARLLSGTGLALVAVGLVLLGRIDPGWGPVQMLPGLLLAGLGLGLAATPITTAAMEHVPAARAGIASATLNAFGMVGMSLGIVVMGAIVAARLPADLAGSGADPAAFAAGIQSGLVVNAVLALVAAGLAVAAIRTPVTRRPPTAPAPATAGADAPGRERNRSGRAPVVATCPSPRQDRTGDAAHDQDEPAHRQESGGYAPVSYGAWPAGVPARCRTGPSLCMGSAAAAPPVNLGQSVLAGRHRRRGWRSLAVTVPSQSLPVCPASRSRPTCATR